MSASPIIFSEPVDLLGEGFSPLPPRDSSSIRSPPDPFLGRAEVDAINASFASAAIHFPAAPALQPSVVPARAPSTSPSSIPPSTTSLPTSYISLALPIKGPGLVEGPHLQGTEVHPDDTPHVPDPSGADPQGRSKEDWSGVPPPDRSRGSVLGRRDGTQPSGLGPNPLYFGSEI